MIRKLAAGIACIIIGISQPLFAQQKVVSKTLDGLSSAEKIVAEADQWVKKIDNKFDEVEKSGAYRTLVDGTSVNFPFAIVPDDGDKKYALVVESVKMDPIKGMTATIMMKITFTTDKILYFLADAVPLSKDGQLSGDFKLYLIKTVPLTVGEGYTISFNGMDNAGAEATYVNFDCRGFKKINVNGTVDFDKNTLQTYKADGSEGQPISSKFVMTADRLGEFMLSLTDLPELQLASLPGFKCSVKGIYIDANSKENPFKTVPAWYNSSNAIDEAWEGCYIESAQIEVPRAYTEGKNEPFVFTLEQLFIDDYGLSAKGGAEHIIENGNMKGFDYSIDQLGVTINQNTLTGAQFTGSIVLPISKKEASDAELALNILLNKPKGEDLQIHGSASLANKDGLMDASAFGNTKMTLTGCRVDFGYKNSQFFPSATIDGSLKVGIKSKKNESKNIAGFGLEVGGLCLNSRKSYISLQEPVVTQSGSIGYVRMTTGSNFMSGLPIQLDSIRIVKSSDDLFGLGMTVKVNFQKSGGESSESGSGFTGSSDFVIWAQQNASKRWSYKDFDLNMIEIGVNNLSYSLYGRVDMYEDDAEYGDGFCGKLDISIIEKIDISAAAIFGSKKDEGSNDVYRYWFVDAAVGFTPGIPIFSGIEINSFTGGLYHHMIMEMSGSKSTGKCASASGRKFVANKSIFVGVMAGLGMQSTGSGTAFNGKINLNVEILEKGGVKKIETWGGVGLLSLSYTPPAMGDVAAALAKNNENKTNLQSEAVRPDGVNGSVVAGWNVYYDFPSKIFSGTFDVFVDVANGLVTGVNGQGHAGRISMYASPQTWYLYVGMPVKMLGLNVMNLAKVKGYFCVGKQLPNPPIAPMPREITPMRNIDEALLGLGAGMALGGRLTIEGSPSVSLGLCSAKAGLEYKIESGFDILIAQSIKPVVCFNDGKQFNRGIDNWYALGQAYIFGRGDVFVKWDCWYFGSGKKNVVGITLSTAVNGQFPRPSYFAGNATAEFRILKESFRKTFDVEFGDICDTKADESNVSFITSITPSSGSTDISVTETILVTFAKSMKSFEYSIAQKSGSGTQKYRPRLLGRDGNETDYAGMGLAVRIKATGVPIDFTYEFNDDMTSAILKPVKVLPENTEIAVTVQVKNQVQVGSGWKDLENTEIMTVTFTTGIEPEQIPESAIRYSYPLPNMTNFYKDEYKFGYIQLNMFPNKPLQMSEADYQYNVIILENGAEIDRVRTVTYDPNKALFEFPIPYIRMDLGREYTLRLVKAPPTSNVSETSHKENELTTGKTLVKRNEYTVVEYKFRTSKYATFKDKMSYYNGSLAEVFNGVMSADLSMNKSQRNGGVFESFSSEEVRGYASKGVVTAQKLIQTGSMMRGIPASGTIEPSGNGFCFTSSGLAETSDKLKNANMQCLLQGGCPAESKVVLDKGTYLLPIEYRLPGTGQVSSIFNISIILSNAVTLPQ